ncbi:uncharacterized protein DS421_17g588420 [Arachis hypogaea]|nr:uncharacterized protein DS421_17g588420 [Arachis hypogaea]
MLKLVTGEDKPLRHPLSSNTVEERDVSLLLNRALSLVLYVLIAAQPLLRYCYDTSKYIVKVLRRLIDVEKAKACASKDDPLELCSPMTKVTLVAEGQNLFDDSAEDILGGNRLGNKFHDSSKSQVLRSSSTDKERANNVAKDQSCVTC